VVNPKSVRHPKEKLTLMACIYQNLAKKAKGDVHVDTKIVKKSEGASWTIFAWQHN